MQRTKKNLQQQRLEQHQEEQLHQALPLVLSLNRVLDIPEPAYIPYPLSSDSYYPEDYGSVSNDKSISKVSDRLAPSRVDVSKLSDAEKVPSEVTFRDEVTGTLYVDVNGRPIAQGSFGAVHVVRSSSGEKMALKVPKPTARIAMIRKEASFLSRVQGHDNVVKFHGVVEDVRGPCLLMQLYQPRDFHALLVNRAPLSVAEIRFFGRQLVAGLSHIHEAGIRHCDLKPENVLVDRGMQLRVTDLGLAEESSVKSNRRAGTPGYWAPEVLEGGLHTNKIDVFSLGIMFYMMFSRNQPDITAEDVVIQPPEDFLDGVAPSSDAKNLLARTLAINVHERIDLPALAVHMFLRYGFCPKSLPDTAFNVAPVFDTTTEKRARSSQENGEKAEALKRKWRWAEKAVVKGQEITRTTSGAKAYRRFVAKEAVKERQWAALLAQVQARIRRERRDLQAEREELRDLFGSDFRDDGRDDQDGSHKEDDDSESEDIESDDAESDS
ncbi:kinase-like domain-containing protein [Linnemannia elongata]|nr:kinase-like domain-containing protein [Linnemannia elongata]